ncbi:hypothetical protein [Acetanaerobacterium elongatum]|uniref:Uncharacterized protein n=1 Tax=Acetanaerobacterium elongatum TaxID=258515 RepID=A0A1G9Y448_9FIRM|nr:hypothetical protein [Acetanaerobacterium elongatum]SDN03797.1 hypothetical protein SAMN05192585_11010 [Acetanaerobacterium elongatum]
MYYMRFINDDGSSEEFEVHQGHIFCKCHECGQEFTPRCIEFDKQFDYEEESFFWNACPDCIKMREAENNRQAMKLAHIELAEKLSRVFKKEITPADVQQFIDDNKGSGCQDIDDAIQKRFGSGSRFVSAREEPQIAQQGKSITI